jgi:hypothetical protein
MNVEEAGDSRYTPNYTVMIALAHFVSVRVLRWTRYHVPYPIFENGTKQHSLRDF